MMSYGILKAIALTYVGTWPVFRLLVTKDDDDFLYLYIPATNYIFRINDIVSWGEEWLFWHTTERVIQFSLLQTSVKIQ